MGLRLLLQSYSSALTIVEAHNGLEAIEIMAI